MGDRLAGKVCIVTGAGSGIGRASAIRFAEEGARVTAVDIDREAVEATVRSIGTEAVAAPADGTGAAAAAPSAASSIDAEVCATYNFARGPVLVESSHGPRDRGPQPT